MNILITGCTGFIGNAFVLRLLKKNKKINIIGLDNLNIFYSIKLKKKILKIIDFKKFSDFYSNVDANINWYKNYNHLI